MPPVHQCHGRRRATIRTSNASATNSLLVRGRARDRKIHEQLSTKGARVVACRSIEPYQSLGPLTKPVCARMGSDGRSAVAGRRTVGLSLWNPAPTCDWLAAAGAEPALSLLPSRLWLIGLGHLGQAYL